MRKMVEKDQGILKLKGKITRRDFFSCSFKSLLGSIGLFSFWSHSLNRSFNINTRFSGVDYHIKNYRPLGNLGYKVSDIGFGTVGFSDSAVLNFALDCGINYIDTAYVYSNGRAEEAVGEVMKNRRREVFLTTKFNTAAFRMADIKGGLEESLNRSLKRLKSDYVDCVMVHNGKVWDVEREELLEFFHRARKEGKVRFLGLSGHGGHTPEAMDKAMETGEYSVFMPAFGYTTYKGVAESMKKASEKGIAVVAMKTLAAAYEARIKGWEKQVYGGFNPRINRFSRDFAASAFSWVLKHDFVSNLVIGMRNIEHVRKYVPASGNEYGQRDEQLLKSYTQSIEENYCRIGCDKCLNYCPNNVAIDDILRFDLYFRNYGIEEEARMHYAALANEKQALSCFKCSAPCDKRCVYGVPIKKKLTKFHELISRYV